MLYFKCLPGRRAGSKTGKDAVFSRQFTEKRSSRPRERRLASQKVRPSDAKDLRPTNPKVVGQTDG